MHDNGSLTRRRYDRIAPLFDAMERPMEMTSFAGWRKELLSSLAGRVLEVGIGTGKNLRYYPVNIELTGIDISPAMLTRARRKASALKLQTDLRLMDVERMTFPDRSFDYVGLTIVHTENAGLSIIKKIRAVSGSSIEQL